MLSKAEKRFFYIAVTIFLIFLSWGIGHKIYWMYGDFVPFTVQEEKITVINAGRVVCAGTPMVYGLTINKLMHGSCTIKREIVNGHRILYDPSYPPEKPLGVQSIVAQIFVPKSADTAEWTMRWSAECPVGPGGERVITINKESEKFAVVDCYPEAVRGPRGFTGLTGPKGDPGSGSTYSIFGGKQGPPGKDAKCINGKCPEPKKK